MSNFHQSRADNYLIGQLYILFIFTALGGWPAVVLTSCFSQVLMNWPQNRWRGTSLETEKTYTLYTGLPQCSAERKTASPTHKTASPTHKTASPTHKTASPTHKTASPTHKTASPTHKTASPTHKTASPTHKTASPTNKISSFQSSQPHNCEFSWGSGHTVDNLASCYQRWNTPSSQQTQQSRRLFISQINMFWQMPVNLHQIKLRRSVTMWQHGDGMLRFVSIFPSSYFTARLVARVVIFIKIIYIIST